MESLQLATVASTESGAGEGEGIVPAYPISGEDKVPPRPKCSGGGAEAIGNVADDPGTVDELM